MKSDKFDKGRPWLLIALFAGTAVGGLVCLVVEQPGGAVFCLIFGLLFGCGIYLPRLHDDFDSTLMKEEMMETADEAGLRTTSEPEGRDTLTGAKQDGNITPTDAVPPQDDGLKKHP